MTHPAYVPPEIPGYLWVSNFALSLNEHEVIQRSAQYLKVEASKIIAMQFKPDALAAPWMWASYVETECKSALHRANALTDYLLLKAWWNSAQ